MEFVLTSRENTVSLFEVWRILNKHRSHNQTIVKFHLISPYFIYQSAYPDIVGGNCTGGHCECITQTIGATTTTNTQPTASHKKTKTEA